MKRLLSPFGFFAIRRGERLCALVFTLVFACWHALTVWHYAPLFTRSGRVGYWSLFIGHFHLSGFDPTTYLILSQWDVYYNATRHPLISLLLWPLAQLNTWLTGLTGYNCAIYLMGALIVVCALYTLLALRRLLHEVLLLSAADATLLSALFFSLAYVMVTVMSPDHFGLSMLLLAATLLAAGRHMAAGRPWAAWRVAALFTLTAGVTLSNGIKTWLAAMFCNGRRAWRPRYLAVAAIVPLALLAAAYAWQDAAFIQPRQAAGRVIEAKKQAQADTAAMERAEEHKQFVEMQNGQPVSHAKYLEWTNMSLSRTRSVWHNLFGEGFILHRDHLLEDIFVSRPIFVPYRSAWPYVAECLLVALLAAGVWCGRRERVLLLCLAWAAFDMALHLGLGFGLNEVYIMTAHWALVVPVALACLLRASAGRWRRALRVVLALLTVVLAAHNTLLAARYLL